MPNSTVTGSRTRFERKRKTINAQSHKNVCRQELGKSNAYKVTHIRKSVSYSCAKFVFVSLNILMKKALMLKDEGPSHTLAICTRSAFLNYRRFQL